MCIRYELTVDVCSIYSITPKILNKTSQLACRIHRVFVCITKESCFLIHKKDNY
jgi:hypothetical protein